MFDRIHQGFSLLGQSWQVLRQDKELVLFPIVSTLCALLMISAMVAPFIVVEPLRNAVMELTHKQGPNGEQVAFSFKVQQVLLYAGLWVFYFVTSFCMIFFNTALASCAMKRFRGENPTFWGGISAAMSCLPQIAAWAALACTVGVILSFIRDNSKMFGGIVSSFLGFVWAVATYLVVPVLAAEKLGPIAAVKRSVSLIRATWGEGLVGAAGLGIAAFVLQLPGLALIAAGIAGAAYFEQIWIALAGIGCGVFMMIVASVATSAMKQIFITSLYMYAAESTIPRGFSRELMTNAFVIK